MTTTNPESDTLSALLSDLVRIPSVNPRLDRSSAGEAALAEHCRAWFEERGIAAWLEPAAEGRPNVVAEVSGGDGPTLVLCAHIDTVGTEGMGDDAFSGRIENGRVYGRGAYDMKGAVAAILLCMERLARQPPPGRVLAALVVDEEYASDGAFDFVRRHRADACIVTEPSALELVLAHKGFVWLEVTTRGVAAHGSRWDLGESAIARMAPVIAALSAFDAGTLRERVDALCGPASLHCGTVRGGEGISTYAAECVLGVERRTIPGERTGDVVAELERVIRAAVPEAEIAVVLTREPMAGPADSPLAGCVRAAAKAVTGRTPADSGVAYWMDAAVFAEAGIATVNIGGAGAGAHAAEEYADVASHASLVSILEDAARRYLGLAAGGAASSLPA